MWNAAWELLVAVNVPQEAFQWSDRRSLLDLLLIST